MLLKNTETQYGAVTKTLHWTIALIVLCQLVVGTFMDDLPLGATKLTVYNMHKSFGILVLSLMCVRILWHIISHRPKAVETMKKRDIIAASAMHYFLYVLLIAMPLTGWLMSSGAGRTVQFFGLFPMPDLVPVDKVTAHIYRERHGQIGYIIMVCVSLHVGAALWHHFIQKDNVLKRMLPVLAFFALLLPATLAYAAAQPWNMIHEKSTITFRPKQLGTEFKGSFEVFSADISFSPDDLAHSKAVVDVHMGTAHTGADDRDANLKSADWLDIAQFPDAKFETTSFRAADKGAKLKPGEGMYIAAGTLTIKNVAVPVELPFTLVISDDADKQTATMDGTLTLDRSKFKIGTGQWADTSIIANEVPVDVHVVAISSKPGK